MRLRGDLVTPYNYLKGGHREKGISLCSQVTNHRTLRNGLIVPEEVWIGHQEEFLHREGGQGSDGLPREMAESPSLEAVRTHMEVAPRDMV